jgi:hypothetical protein
LAREFGNNSTKISINILLKADIKVKSQIYK